MYEVFLRFTTQSWLERVSAYILWLFSAILAHQTDSNRLFNSAGAPWRGSRPLPLGKRLCLPVHASGTFHWFTFGLLSPICWGSQLQCECQPRFQAFWPVSTINGASMPHSVTFSTWITTGTTFSPWPCQGWSTQCLRVLCSVFVWEQILNSSHVSSVFSVFFFSFYRSQSRFLCLQTTILLSFWKAIHDVFACCCQAQPLVDMHTIVGIECGQAEHKNHEIIKALGFGLSLIWFVMDSIWTLVTGAVWGRLGRLGPRARWLTGLECCIERCWCSATLLNLEWTGFMVYSHFWILVSCSFCS